MDNAADSAVVDAVLDGDARVLRDAENTACAAGRGIRAGNRAIVDTVFNHEVAADHRADNTRNTAAGARNLTADGDVLDRDIARRIADKTPTVGYRRGLDVEPLDLGVGAVCLLDTDECALESSGGIADRGLIGLAGHVDIILKNDILVPQGCVAHQRFQVCRTCEIDLAVCRRCKSGCAHHKREHDQQQAKRQRQTENFAFHKSLPFKIYRPCTFLYISSIIVFNCKPSCGKIQDINVSFFFCFFVRTKLRFRAL